MRAEQFQQSLLPRCNSQKSVANLFRRYIRLMYLDVVIVIFQCRPYIVQQGIKLACFQRIARHFLRIDIPQLRHYIQLGAELYDFAIDGQTDHDSRLAFFVYLILPNVEKNLECTLAHNTSFFASLPRVKTFSGKEIINNWVVSRHFEDNKRQIRDLP